MPKRSDPREPFSFVHRDTRIDGTVRAEGRLRIDGVVYGAVQVGGLLEIAPGGRIENGPVRARDVRVAGVILGDVDAEGTVEIWDGGCLEGDVRAGALDVDEGGRFLGHSGARDEAANGGDRHDSGDEPEGSERATRAEAPAAVTDRG